MGGAVQLITGLTLLLMLFTTAFGGEPNDYIAVMTREAAKEWSATRGCNITPDGVNLLVKRFERSAFDFRAKAMKYNLSYDEEAQTIKGVAQAYLDQVSIQEFGPSRARCVLRTAALIKTGFPAMATNPDTGILDVDGSERGARILIDGEAKGNIRQAFILSIGGHTWKTMKCEDSVRISPKETIKVYCNEK